MSNLVADLINDEFAKSANIRNKTKDYNDKKAKLESGINPDSGRKITLGGDTYNRWLASNPDIRIKIKDTKEKCFEKIWPVLQARAAKQGKQPKDAMNEGNIRSLAAKMAGEV